MWWALTAEAVSEREGEEGEFIRPNEFKDMEEIKEQLGVFFLEDSHLGRHAGLEYMTPFDKLKIVTESAS